MEITFVASVFFFIVFIFLIFLIVIIVVVVVLLLIIIIVIIVCFTLHQFQKIWRDPSNLTLAIFSAPPTTLILVHYMQNFTLVEVNLFVVFCSLEIVSRTIHHLWDAKFGFLLLLFPHLIVVVVFFIPWVIFSWHGHEGFKISTPLCYWIKLYRTSPTSCSATIFHQPQAIRTPFDYFHIFSLGQEHIFTNFMSFGAAVDISGVFV